MVDGYNKEGEIMEYEDKVKEQKKIEKKLKEIIKNLADDKRKTLENLISNIAFMSVELNCLQEQIRREGCLEYYQNGANQKGRKPSSAIQVYNATAKTFNTSVKLLISALDSKEQKNEKNELVEFLKSG